MENILNSLQSQNMVSDVDTSNNGELPSLDGTSINPLMMLVMVLATMWALLNLSSGFRGITEKPSGNRDNRDNGNNEDRELF